MLIFPCLSFHVLIVYQSVAFTVKVTATTLQSQTDQIGQIQMTKPYHSCCTKVRREHVEQLIFEGKDNLGNKYSTGTNNTKLLDELTFRGFFHVTAVHTTKLVCNASQKVSY